MARRTCFDCDHVDEREVKDKKVWCRSYKMYCYPEDADRCKRFEMTSGSSGGCYLTTACVEYRGLPDDCVELTTLRSFRDSYLVSQENGKEEINEYYETAPQIVRAINASGDAGRVYTELYDSVILPCVELIKNGRQQEAYEMYKKMVEDMRSTYC